MNADPEPPSPRPPSSTGAGGRGNSPRDPSGRLYNILHYWDEWGGSSYSATAIVGNGYAYDAYRGLRTENAVLAGAGGSSWSTSRTEYYAYDADLDYLTEVDYNDGIANEYQTWTYDAAGNRATDSVQGSGWTYDNLNRITASPGFAYYHDILGNRTWRNYGTSGVVRYKWDDLNRATSICNTTTGAAYVYRADGMRVQKNEGLSIEYIEPEEQSPYYDENWAVNVPTTRYYYDGQMMVEDDFTTAGQFGGQVVTVMRYGIGARGIDFMAKKVGTGSETQGFPIYDGHGNMIATLGRSGSSPYFGIADQRSYDAWGNLRSGSSTGDPKQRYCANLGHVQDDESGLIYMRARYYEPWTGRFVSEDPARNGSNFFVYSGNNPVGYVDPSGEDWLSEYGHLFPIAIGLLCFSVGAILLNVSFRMNLRASTILELAQEWALPGDPYGRLATARKEALQLRGNAARLARIGRAGMRGGMILTMLGLSLITRAYLIDADMAAQGLPGPMDFIEFD